MKTRLYKTSCLVAGVIISLVLVTECAKLSEEKPRSKVRGQYPVLELQDSIKLDMYDGSYLAWILKTHYMRKMANSDILFAKPVDMVLYDSSKKETAWVQADSGSADESVNFVSVWGNVYVKSLEGATVEADSLTWKKRGNQIRTDGWVKVVSQDGDTLTGVGFISDDKLENWKILSSVRGVIQKVEERVQESEEPSTGDSTVKE